MTTSILASLLLVLFLAGQPIHKVNPALRSLRQRYPIQYHPMYYDPASGRHIYSLTEYTFPLDSVEIATLPLPQWLRKESSYHWRYCWEMPLWNNVKLVYCMGASQTKLSTSGILATYDNADRLLDAMWVGTVGDAFKRYYRKRQYHPSETDQFYIALHPAESSDLQHYQFQVQGILPTELLQSGPHLRRKADVPVERWSIDKKGMFRLDSVTYY